MDVKTILFSNGTYQIEVDSYWVLLHLDDTGEVLDQFCSCDQAGCPHGDAARQAIFRGYKAPLHVRFKHSLWAELFRLLEKRGKQEGVVSLQMRSDLAKEFEREWITERKVETEETSLKFSNLPQEELDLFRKGRPSDALRFELSMWGALAEWFMIREDQGVSWHIRWGDKTLEAGALSHAGALPECLFIEGEDCVLEALLEPSDFPKLIGPISRYETNLKVFDFNDMEVSRITFDGGAFHIHAAPLTNLKKPD